MTAPLSPLELARRIVDGAAFADADAVVVARELLNTSPEWRGVYPGMCVDPEICRGRSSCPRAYSCCE